MEQEIYALKQHLETAKKILLINHRRMDGDAFGSLSGFYYILKKLGCYEVKAINDEHTPESFRFLQTEEIFSPELDIKKYAPDLIISFDAAGIEQLGESYKKYQSTFDSTPFVVIDHHPSNPRFGKINIIDLEASSTCEIVYDIIKIFHLEKYIDSQIATFLLTGVITDTNSFFNTNSSSKSLKTAGELMMYQPRHQDIIIHLFKKKPYARIKLWGHILESLKDMEQGKIVWNTIPRSVFLETKTTDKDISGLIDEFLTTVDGLEVAFLLYELENHTIKGSFRGKTDRIDLSAVCSHFGGGGHKRASGFCIEAKNIYEVEQEVLQVLKKYM